MWRVDFSHGTHKMEFIMKFPSRWSRSASPFDVHVQTVPSPTVWVCRNLIIGSTVHRWLIYSPPFLRHHLFHQSPDCRWSSSIWIISSLLQQANGPDITILTVWSVNLNDKNWFSAHMHTHTHTRRCYQLNRLHYSLCKRVDRNIKTLSLPFIHPLNW